MLPLLFTSTEVPGPREVTKVFPRSAKPLRASTGSPSSASSTPSPATPGCQIDDTVAKVNDIAPLGDKWAAFGWNVIEVEDGNDVEQVSAAVKHAKLGRGSERPTMVILNTKKGCGVKWIEDLGAGNHNTNVTAEQAEAAIRELRGEA